MLHCDTTRPPKLLEIFVQRFILHAWGGPSAEQHIFGSSIRRAFAGAAGTLVVKQDMLGS